MSKYLRDDTCTVASYEHLHRIIITFYCLTFML